MKELIKSSGIVLILLGVCLLAYSLLKGQTTNVWLITSTLMIVVGLLSHIMLNKYLT